MFVLPTNFHNYVIYNWKRKEYCDDCLKVEEVINCYTGEKYEIPHLVGTYGSDLSDFKFTNFNVEFYSSYGYSVYDYSFHNDKYEVGGKIGGVFFGLSLAHNVDRAYNLGGFNNLYFEIVECDEVGNFHLHAVANEIDPKLFKFLQFHVYKCIRCSGEVKENIRFLSLKAMQLSNLVANLKNFPNIDISAPKSEDRQLVLPLECTYNKKFFSRLFLLQNHVVQSQTISQFDLLQYQISIRADNEELLLLICGEHFLNPLIDPPMVRPGKLCIFLELDHVIQFSPILNLIYCTQNQVLSGESSFLLTNSEAGALFDSAVKKLSSWIKTNYTRAYNQFVRRTSEVVRWTNEFRLYQFAKIFFHDAVYQYKAEWLGEQSLDIFIPSRKVAIEYQGKQHYESVGHFGGIFALQDNQKRDSAKRKKCEKQGVTLLEWPYTLKVYFMEVTIYFSEKFPDCNFTRENMIAKIERENSFPIINLLEERYHYREESRKVGNNEKCSSQKAPSLQYVVRQYDKNGKFLSSFSSYDEAEQTTGIKKTQIQKVVHGHGITAGNYQWRRVSINEAVADIASLTTKSHTSAPKPILQIDLNGTVLSEYPSISAAAKAVGVNSKSIREVLNGHQKTAGGFAWLYAE